MTTPVQEFYAGLGVLGYQFIPDSAFDSAGNIVLPSDFRAPPEWAEVSGRIASVPAWSDLHRVLGALTVSGSPWYSWRVAVSFHNGVMRVIVARARTSNVQVDTNWSTNFWNVVVPSLQRYAGRRYLVPPGLAETTSRAASDVKSSSYWTRDPAPGWSDEQKNAFIVKRDATRWRVNAALTLAEHLLSFIAQATIAGKVLVTTLWYDTTGAVPASQLGGYQPLHQVYSAGTKRLINYWWNWKARTAPGRFSVYPFVFSSSVQRTGIGVVNVAHQPWELAAAVYPDGSWGPTLGLQAHDLQDTAEDPTVYSLVAAAPARQAFGVDVPEEMFASDSASASLIAAHEIPDRSGSFLAFGTLVDGTFVPEGSAQLPELIWLPAVGVLASREDAGHYRMAGQLPAASLTPLPSEAAADRATVLNPGDA